MSKPGGLSPRKYFFVILFEIVSSQILTFYKRVVRYALHIITGRTELERICLNEKVESTRIRKIGAFIYIFLILLNKKKIILNIFISKRD